MVRHHVPVRAAGRVQPGRRADQGPARRPGRAGRPLPPGRQQDVDLGRRPGRQREHRPPGAGQGARPRRSPARGHGGDLAVHRAQAAAGRDPQRRDRGGPEPQDGLSRHGQLPAELRREGRGRGLDRRRAGRGPAPDVPDDERGADRRRGRRGGAGLSQPPAVGRLCARTAAGPPGRPALGAARRHHRASRRAPDAAAAEGLCGRRAGPVPLLRPPGRHGRRLRSRRRPAGPADAGRQDLALGIRPGGQRHRDPGARRLRLHTRLRRRATVARQPAQPHPRGHDRYPGHGPGGAQDPCRTGRGCRCWARRSRARPRPPRRFPIWARTPAPCRRPGGR